jgi:hypothetical protein
MQQQYKVLVKLNVVNEGARGGTEVGALYVFSFATKAAAEKAATFFEKGDGFQMCETKVIQDDVITLAAIQVPE